MFPGLINSGILLNGQKKIFFDNKIPDETFHHSAAIENHRQTQKNIKTEVGENMEVSMQAETGYPAQFRGTNCCGVAPAGAHPPVSLLPDENMAWKTKVGEGVSSPCLWENKIFLTGFNTDENALLTYSISRESGAILWEEAVYPDTLETIHSVGSHAAATPTTDGKHVYVYFGSYGVVCYDFEGNLVWEKKLPVLKTRYGSCASPVILKNKLILNRFEVDNPVILALEPSTGETIWKTNLSVIPGLTEALQRSQSTPVLWNDQIILHRSLALCSVNIDDGKENWTIPLVSMGTSTPVIFDDVLYVNGYSNLGEARLYDKLPDFKSMVTKYDENQDSLMQFQEIPEDLAFFRRPDLDLPLKYDTSFSWNLMAPLYDISQDKALNEPEWKGMEQFWSKFYEEHGVVAIDLKKAGKTNESDFLWKENEYIAEVPSLLCTGSQVYMISNGGLVTCMNTETGEVIYREKLGAPGAYIASPLLANGHIYFVSYNGRITVVKQDDKLNVVSQCNLKEKVAASPVASENQLFVRTTETLYAFEK
jgi:outer membrane protein assembly factor BamB